MKKPRLFLLSDSLDETWCHCGGPDKEDALNGLRNMLEPEVFDLLAGRKPEGTTIQLKVEMMTDEEVAKLPDLT